MHPPLLAGGVFEQPKSALVVAAVAMIPPHPHRDLICIRQSLGMRGSACQKSREWRFVGERLDPDLDPRPRPSTPPVAPTPSRTARLLRENARELRRRPPFE